MDIQKQAEIYCKYLIGKKPNSKTISLFEDAMKKLDFQADKKDRKIENFVYKFPFILPTIDGGLALIRKNSIVRKKAFTMLAILETIPEYSDKFLSKKHSIWYFFIIAFIGIRSVLRGVLGVVLVKII
ncbi:MAG: hypothetical protein K9J13_03070 [Saprospiraceae bacterium]|nr:hypothetical protein [Saprospiraceae bacterium]